MVNSMAAPEFPVSPPPWLTERLHSAADDQREPAMILDCACQGIDRHALATNLANYLNEFDSSSHPNWHPLSHTELTSLLRQWDQLQIPSLPASPLAGLSFTSEADLAWNLCQLGGVILEEPFDFARDVDLRSCFQVCLCCRSPSPFHLAHLWINPSRFAPSTLVTVIADSFLNWSSANDRPAACAS